MQDGELTWRADARIPMGDAAVEFWSGDKLLGRPVPSPDRKTFTLDAGETASLPGLAVRAGGRRLDQAEPPARRRAATTVELPPAQLAHTVDPGVRGPYRTAQGEYALDAVKLADFPEKVEMQAVVVAPVGASGARPLALFLHGRHEVCYRGADEVPQQWPCPAGTQPVPSHRGYLQAQELLASQGYLTVSIAANGINGQDDFVDDGGAQARSSLVRRHLAEWARWESTGRVGAPEIVASAARADLSRVFLVGHSRGGEGVSRAAMDSLTPPPAAQDGYTGKARWDIRGMLLIAPTIFGQNPVPDVPSVTILPGCDGDVSDLEGQLYVDETRRVSQGKALHSALYMVGANHNFFNTEWTPGQSAAPSSDDFYGGGEHDPVCSPGTATRLSAAHQQTAGATYIAAAARLFAAGDDQARPLLDGSGVRASSAGPARVFSHAIGGRRTPVMIPDSSVAVSEGARICQQVTRDVAAACLDPNDAASRSGHFVPFGPLYSEADRDAAELSWSSAGKPVRLTSARPVAVGDARDLALRVMVPPNVRGTRFSVAVITAGGKRTVLGDVRVDGLPGSQYTAAHWAQEVRVPLNGFQGRVKALELTPQTPAGRAWLIDAWAWSPGTSQANPPPLPRLDIGKLQVDEGDSGVRTYQIPVTVTGKGSGQVRLFLHDRVTRKITSWPVTVRAGERSIPVPIKVTGDPLYGRGQIHQLFAKAEQGFVIGDYDGGLDIVDDDPMPTVTVTPTTARVAEGGTLRWRVELSAPTETPFDVSAFPQAPAGGPELSTTDVDPEWFRNETWQDPEPSLPLSQSALLPFAHLEPGRTTAEITIPTITDQLTEPDETVELHFSEDPRLPPVTGIVTGA